MIKSIKITKEQKYILIAGMVLLFIGALYRFYPDVYGFVSAADDIEFKKRSIEKYLQVVAQQKGLEKQKNQLNHELTKMEAKLLTGNTPSLAAVEVQGIINEIVQSNNIKVQTMQVLEPKESGDIGYVAIPVRFSFASNIFQLKDIICKIESPAKLLAIKELSVDRNARGSTGEIRATMTVEGVMKGSLKETAPLAPAKSKKNLKK